ncbi:TonB-dependent receptor [Tunicatimonas pelagia]|uniref:TonB-dependent receptor n=1 Tax=Tunicatimonas pelagia TaxID=931531 RepID=UPI0026657F65|nr:TonB-dependent receptor [Tunicatimonas pelagia]WKN42985.1 TonB-dependent receptor [Tunicatimonas pelagia]
MIIAKSSVNWLTLDRIWKVAFSFFLTATFHPSFAEANQCQVTLTILDEDRNEIIGAYIEIPEVNQKAVSNISGEATFLLSQGTTYTLYVSSLGFETVQHAIKIPTDGDFQLQIILKESTTSLDEVVISGKSQRAAAEELPYKAQIVNLSTLRAQPIQVTTLLNQLPGVRIRQEGGAGSDANIMLNGIDGKGVKLFVDGIPVYLLGAGYALNTISPGMIEHIEVYKGTIPVDYGSDALGGVINVVSRYGNAEYADVSYGYGSWNTHEASVTVRENFGSQDNYFINLDGFYNYSDNNYWMDNVDVVVDDLFNTEKGRARRFNDRFQSLLTRFQAGVRNQRRADELMLMSSFSRIDREWQHGLRAEVPWGEPASIQDSWNAAISWKKYGKSERWNASIVAGYTYDQLNFVDTARRTYFWDQNFTSKINGGETGLYSNGTRPVLTTRTLFSRESFSYSLNNQHTLNLTMLLTNDELRIQNEVLPQEDQEGLLPAQKLLKNYTGLALASEFFGSKLTNTVSAKHFYTRSSGVTFDNRMVGPRETNEFSIFGYGDVIQYQMSPLITMNLGYEFTVRQPDDEEIFGNYLTVAPNPSLNPEQSHNINFGTEYSTYKKRFNAGMTFFYRNTSDRIFLNAVTFGLARYENLIGTQAVGAEFHADYLIFGGLRAAVNATYQDITLQETSPEGNIPNRYLGSRVPNTPYLFGNGQLSYSRKSAWLGNGTINAGYDFNYVHEFFLSWAEDGRAETKDIIPTQALHNINFSWMAPKDRWSIGVECRNLTDARAFDNFSVQRPGRSFYVKARVFFGT